MYVVEPILTPRGPGRIILLNGASSSGKSTLAKALQDVLDEPFLHVSSDQLVAAGMFPARREDGGPFDWWHEMRPRFFAGFHCCLPALATAGNDLIVEHIIEFNSWRNELAVLLADFDVFLVGVHCALDELDRRERIRGDRRIGEGRTHVEVDRIHTFGHTIWRWTPPPASVPNWSNRSGPHGGTANRPRPCCQHRHQYSKGHANRGMIGRFDRAALRLAGS